MIQSFADKVTAAVFRGLVVRRLPHDLQRIARRKLRQLDQARRLEDLRIPPGNRLEALHGDRAGQFSVRVNDQWRPCFVWQDGDAFEVQLTDYH